MRRRVGWSQKQQQSLKRSQAKQAPAAIPPIRRLVLRMQATLRTVQLLAWVSQFEMHVKLLHLKDEVWE